MQRLSRVAGVRRTAPPDALADEQLLASGEAEAFALFYRRHVRDLLAHLMRLTGDAEVAADIMAETFAAALASWAAYDPARGAPRAWLFGIGHKKLADFRRRGYAELRALQRLGMQRVELSADDRQEIEYLAGIAAAELVDELPGDQRRAVAGRVIHDRTYEELARELAVSEQTVRKRVSRGLTFLRHRLGLADEAP